MTQLLIIRPGSTDYEQQRRIRGRLDIPLNQQGRDEVEQILESLRARNLTPRMIFCSPCRPARETAGMLGKALRVKVKEVPQLRNLNYGLWQGMCINEVRTKQPKVYRQWQDQPDYTCPPEGEMLADAEARLHDALAKIAKVQRDGCVALVVPEPLATVLHRFLTHDNLGNLWRAEEHHGEIEVLDVSLRGFRPASPFTVWGLL